MIRNSDWLEIRQRVYSDAVSVAKKLGATEKMLTEIAHVRVKDLEKRSATAGTWWPRDRKILMNVKLCSTPERYEKTLRHEWAHALVSLVVALLPHPVTKQMGVRLKSHGPEWKHVARLMGHSGDRCHSYDVVEAMPDRYHEYVCPGCSVKMTFTKVRVTKMRRAMEKGRTFSCRRCKTPVDLSPKVPLLKAAETADTLYTLGSSAKNATQMFCALIMLGTLTDDTIFSLVQKRFGTDERHRKNYVAWYRMKLRKEGKNPPPAI